MSTRARSGGRTTPKGHVPAKRPSSVARKQPHIKAVGSEKHLGGSIQGLVVLGDQVMVRCTVDGWLCMCPKDKADWNFHNHVRQAKGLPVQTEQERLEMAIDVTDVQALTAAPLDAEVKIDFFRAATDAFPEYRTTIFMKKRDYLADPESAESMGEAHYANRNEMILNPPQPEPLTKDEQIAELRTELAAMQERLVALEAEPDATEAEATETEPVATETNDVVEIAASDVGTLPTEVPAGE